MTYNSTQQASNYWARVVARPRSHAYEHCAPEKISEDIGDASMKIYINWRDTSPAALRQKSISEGEPDFIPDSLRMTTSADSEFTTNSGDWAVPTPSCASMEASHSTPPPEMSHARGGLSSASTMATDSTLSGLSDSVPQSKSSLTALAAANGITLEALAQVNPHIVDMNSSLPVGTKLRLPTPSATPVPASPISQPVSRYPTPDDIVASLQATIAAAYAENDTLPQSINGQAVLTLSSTSLHGGPSEVPSPRDVESVSTMAITPTNHTTNFGGARGAVPQSKSSLTALAAANGIALNALAQANPHITDMNASLPVGTRLRLPTPSSTPVMQSISPAVRSPPRTSQYAMESYTSKNYSKGTASTATEKQPMTGCGRFFGCGSKTVARREPPTSVAASRMQSPLRTSTQTPTTYPSENPAAKSPPTAFTSPSGVPVDALDQVPNPLSTLSTLCTIDMASENSNLPSGTRTVPRSKSSLTAWAAQYGVDVAALAQANPHIKDMNSPLPVGTKITMPTSRL